MTWWLSCSAAELDSARTCRNCGCKDADIDIGLCFECFCEERRANEIPDPREDPRTAEYEAEMERIANPTGLRSPRLGGDKQDPVVGLSNSMEEK